MRWALNAALLQLVFASSLLLGSSAPGDDYTVNIAVRSVTPIAPANAELYPLQDVSIRLLLDPIDGHGGPRICEYPPETELAVSGRPFLSPPPWECSTNVSGPDPALLVMVQVWLHFEAGRHPPRADSDRHHWLVPAQHAVV